ncbi:DeoR family transcriptional regulator [Neolewinella xylanilytica]|uniref:DeoR family transcriptional regulator n=1 Tax=Neolewinella xylanilytica TaxID=1514080 RepID=A0A2S6I9K9_9BACT|nr:DeoR/GlpR family DNA-binding transcription regulator [Neolewinella xylanilytica]PPK88184.1 DeoR family transcriptional regulator [Neolewinella xylanilytica]
MLKEARFRYILEVLHREGQVRLKALSEELRVSTDTVRRDLTTLAERGSLTPVRGGALPVSGVPSAYRAREQQATAAKEQIARKALTLIEDGQLIMLDGGTTAACLARLLYDRRGLTVVTNSFPIVTTLMDHPDVDVRFAGGKLHRNYRIAVGPETIDFLRQFRATWSFLGTFGLHPGAGLTVADDREAAVKRAMIQSADRVAAMVTNDKLGKAEPNVVCGLADLDTLITSDDILADDLRSYRQPRLRML